MNCINIEQSVEDSDDDVENDVFRLICKRVKEKSFSKCINIFRRYFDYDLSRQTRKAFFWWFV